MLFDERIMAFIPSSDLARSREFYEGVLDLTVEDFNDYACLVRSAEGGLVRITKVADLRPQPFTVLGWLVTDIREAVAGLALAGVEFTRYDGMNQDEDGVWKAPGGALVAWFPDPDGNVLSLTEDLNV